MVTKMDEIRFVEMMDASSYLRNICEPQTFEMVRISHPIMMEVASLSLRSDTSYPENVNNAQKYGLLSIKPRIEHEL